jgi:hypothetical protein
VRFPALFSNKRSRSILQFADEPLRLWGWGWIVDRTALCFLVLGAVEARLHKELNTRFTTEDILRDLTREGVLLSPEIIHVIEAMLASMPGVGRYAAGVNGKWCATRVVRDDPAAARR